MQLNMRSNSKEKEIVIGISELEEDKLSQMVRDFIELDHFETTLQVDELVDHNPTTYLSLQVLFPYYQF